MITATVTGRNSCRVEIIDAWQHPDPRLGTRVLVRALVGRPFLTWSGTGWFESDHMIVGKNFIKDIEVTE